MGSFTHRLALCESEQVGEGTRIWAFAHVMAGAVVGRDCNIGDGAFIESGAVLGDRVTVKNQAMIWDGVSIADDVFIGPGVIFTNDRTPRSPRMSAAAARYADPSGWRVSTTIGRGASLGAGAIIVGGVTISDYALVGAGSVVTRDVPPHRLVVGNPARGVGWACVCGARLSLAVSPANRSADRAMPSLRSAPQANDSALNCLACGKTFEVRTTNGGDRLSDRGMRMSA